MKMDDLNLVAVAITALAAIASWVVATFAIRATHRRTRIDFFLEASRIFKLDQMREAKATIYHLNREEFSTWSDDEKRIVEKYWGNIDLISTLASARHVDKRALLNMYGDVLFRTLYVCAPYINAMRADRGDQYLLPTRSFLPSLLRSWQRSASRGNYPESIRMPGQPAILLTSRHYLDDSYIASVLRTRAIRSF